MTGSIKIKCSFQQGDLPEVNVDYEVAFLEPVKFNTIPVPHYEESVLTEDLFIVIKEELLNKIAWAYNTTSISGESTV